LVVQKKRKEKEMADQSDGSKYGAFGESIAVS